MNWKQMKYEVRNPQLYQEFCESYQMTRQMWEIAVLRTEKNWALQISMGSWRIELRTQYQLARLRNVITGQTVCDEEKRLYIAMKQFFRKKAGYDGQIKNKIGLVFSGGGAKGAYEIGVWKALCQLGLVDQIGGISGTSIGAVNAFLFALGDLGNAVKVWVEMCDRELRRKNRNHLEKFTGIYSREKGSNPIYNLYRETANDMFISQPELAWSLDKITTDFGKAQAMDRIRRYHIYTTATPDEGLLKGAALSVSKLAAVGTNREKPRYINWNQLCYQDIKDAVICSAALPFFFHRGKFQDKRYYDGGLLDNTPFEPLYEIGYRKFIVVYLSKANSKEVQASWEKIQKRKDAYFIQIVPSKSFEDGFPAMLSLEKEAIQSRIQTGYKDAMHILSHQNSL